LARQAQCKNLVTIRFRVSRVLAKHGCSAVASATADYREGVSPKRPTMRPIIFRAVVFATLLHGQLVSADWRVVSSNSEASIVSGVEHRRVVLENPADRESATFDLALFSPKSVTLRVIDNAGGSEDLAGAMLRAKGVAGVNGGYFDAKFKALGLRVIDGTTSSPLLRGHLLTGVLCSSTHSVEIFRLGEFSRTQKCEAAIECGPFLIDRASPVRGLNHTRRACRTFIAMTRRQDSALGISSDLSLAELAAALGAIADFKIWRALNLDGGSSSAFWFRKKDGSVISIPEEKRVRDFVGIVPR